MCKKGNNDFKILVGKRLKNFIDISIDNIIKIILKFIFKERAETLWTGLILISIGNNSDPF